MIANLISLLGFLVLLTGLVVSIQGARRKKNVGFWVIACWFALSIGSMGSGKAREAQRNRQRGRLPPPPAGTVRVPVKTVSIPIMPAVLVAGVWLVGRDEKQEEQQNQ